jgi:large subunit ribosomal protein L21
MNYAVIAHSGKQFKVSEGDIVELEKVNLPAGHPIEFPEIMMIQRPEGALFGRPLVENARVTGKVLGHFKGKKILIFKHKRRKNYRRTQGHRQNYTRVKIENIVQPGN